VLNKLDIVHTQLETARKDLLNLGLGNKLISYKPLRARGLEVVDELPEEIFRILVGDGKSMSFLPTAGDEGSAEGAQPEGNESPRPAGRYTDSRLQTSLSPANLQTRLLSTYRLANTFIQEQGVNTLFLALGMVNWYESDSSQDARKAPLILIPVYLERTDVNDRFHLTYSGDEIGGNLSFKEKIRDEFHLTLPDLPDPDDLAISEFFDAVENAVQIEPRWSVNRGSVVLAFFSFSKFLMYRDLDLNTWPEEENVANHPVLGALLDKGFKEPPSEADDDTSPDPDLTSKEIYHVVDADGSQISALLDVNQGLNMVVQGPPGTGKSQTITNMIAQALGADQTVLFVSEKMAALDVVKRRLDSIGLGDACLELHSNKTAKKAVLQELSRTNGLGKPLLGIDQSASEELARVRTRLDDYSEALREPIGDSGVNAYHAFGAMIKLREQTGGTPLPTLNIPTISLWTGADYRRKLAVVEELQGRLAIIKVPRDHVFWGSQLTSIMPTALDQLKLELVVAQESLVAIEVFTAKLAERMNLQIPSDPSEIAALCYSAQLAIESPDVKGVMVQSGEWETQKSNLDVLIDAGKELTLFHSGFDDVLVPEAWQQEVETIRDTLVAKGSKFWRLLSKEYRTAKSRLKALCSASMPSSVDEQIGLVNAILAAQAKHITFEQHQALGKQLFREKWKSEDSNWHELGPLPEYIGRVNNDVEAGKALSGIFSFLESGQNTTELESDSSDVLEASLAHINSCDAVQRSIDLDLEKRNGSVDGLADQSWGVQKHDLDRWLDEIDSIHDIISFNNITKVLRDENLEAVVANAESWTDASDSLTDAFTQAWFEGLLNRAFNERDALSSFDGISQRQVVERFQKLDLEMLEHNRVALAVKHWEALQSSEDVGQMGILAREFNKKRRHLPIRQLVAQAGNAIQSIKPVMMMSPLSIANYLPPGKLQFDLVIFDEASQVKPVDAFGAIMRGRQTVVVGDDKQLPPTNFFEAVTQDGDDDDDDALTAVTADIESILGLFSSRRAPNRMLRWHYRSRHESLIAVSNQEFYENNLLIFPCPDAESETLGLRFHHLPNTTYDRGGSSTNVMEANAVAEAVMKHARDCPKLTLGVAAFSVKQREVILDQLEMLRRENPAHENFFNSHTHEPFFVKNLETIQGDERDVIIISVGYGRQPNGRISMDFGPLNKDGGQRRLNVLITRAKQRCEVFTNLVAADIDLSRTNAWGVRALKSYLAYAEHGTLEIPTESGRDSGSPFFQDVVASRLRRLGYEINQEIGSAGYFVDLAVVDQGKRGRYVLGIECDGATYHSSRYARDRDRLRRQVLEGLNWRICRVWSTDWFRNPERELTRLVDEIESAKVVVPQFSGVDIENGLTIERAEAALFKVNNSQKTPGYQLAKLDIRLRGLELHATPRSTMASWITEVVRLESPVHIDEVGRRIADAAGVGRIGRLIRESLLEATRFAARSGSIRIDDNFLWWSDMNQPTPRNREGLKNTSKKLELVDLSEISAAAFVVVAGARGIRREELPAPTVRILGFAKVTENMRIRVGLAIDKMVVEKRIEEQGGLIVVS